jgi:hypothetical protein
VSLFQQPPLHHPPSHVAVLAAADSELRGAVMEIGQDEGVVWDELFYRLMALADVIGVEEYPIPRI